MKTHSRLFIVLSVIFSICSQATQKNVYVDGVYDLAHYGHARSFQKARVHAARKFEISPSQVNLIVGVCDNDGNLKAYKREPVFNLEKRVAQVQSFKGVDRVIANAPMSMTDAFIDAHHIDLVMHGDDFNETQIDLYYEVAAKRGIFATFPYEAGISTSEILRLATRNWLGHLFERTNLTDSDCHTLRAALDAIERL